MHRYTTWRTLGGVSNLPAERHLPDHQPTGADRFASGVDFLIVGYHLVDGGVHLIASRSVPQATVTSIMDASPYGMLHTITRRVPRVDRFDLTATMKGCDMIAGDSYAVALSALSTHWMNNPPQQ